MDNSYENIGRIPYKAAYISTIILYTTAVIAALLRGFVRWHYGQLRLLDDGFVVFSVACMTASFGLWITYVHEVYITEALIYSPFSVLGQIADVIQVAVDIQIFSTAYIVLSVTGIFAIKFSFLFFFRHLIDRIHKLQIYWRGIAIYTAIVWVVSISISPVACPFYDARAVECAQGPFFYRALDISIALLVFDVSTDFLIISIPVILIRQIKIPLKSKLYLAATLCLSFVMMVVAILQGATITYQGVNAIDVVWELYFQFIELTLAILVVSLTAFRTLFVGRRSKNSRRVSTPSHKKWYSNGSAKRIWKILSSRSGTTYTEDTAWSGQTTDIPLSNGPLPSMVQPETHSPSRRTSERPALKHGGSSDRKSSSRRIREQENGLSSHPTTDFGGTTLASQSDAEPYIGSTLDGPLLDMPIGMPALTPEETEDQITDTRPRRPRSQISAERRISYFQRMIRQGMERATAVIMPGRSNSPSTQGRITPLRAATTSIEDEVSPVDEYPERFPGMVHQDRFSGRSLES